MGGGQVTLKFETSNLLIKQLNLNTTRLTLDSDGPVRANSGSLYYFFNHLITTGYDDPHIILTHLGAGNFICYGDIIRIKLSKIAYLVDSRKGVLKLNLVVDGYNLGLLDAVEYRRNWWLTDR